MVLPTFNSDNFSWRNGNGTAFASDLGITAETKFLDQFYIKSSRTGQLKLFLPGTPIFNGHGEDREFTGATYFIPGGNVEVTIFND